MHGKAARRQGSTAKRGFTLAEMIAAIALLTIFSVVVVQLFAASHTLAGRADRIDGAVLCARNLAESWQAGAQQADAGSLAAGVPTRLYYDADLSPVPEKEAAYLVDVLMSTERQKGTESLKITILDPAGGTLFELTAGRLIQAEVKP